mmetsp:Transcript_37949/g.117278  ORF Transcript_37949/g.117278 Transcript_37949/m.117278 type:complete len:276 (+) Transcript_37949:975-1802(+)
MQRVRSTRTLFSMTAMVAPWTSASTMSVSPSLASLWLSGRFRTATMMRFLRRPPAAAAPPALALPRAGDWVRFPAEPAGRRAAPKLELLAWPAGVVGCDGGVMLFGRRSGSCCRDGCCGGGACCCCCWYAWRCCALLCAKYCSCCACCVCCGCCARACCCPTAGWRAVGGASSSSSITTSAEPVDPSRRPDGPRASRFSSSSCDRPALPWEPADGRGCCVGGVAAAGALVRWSAGAEPVLVPESPAAAAEPSRLSFWIASKSFRLSLMTTTPTDW